jgi:hypothetical protein
MDEYPRNFICEFSMDEWIKVFDEYGKNTWIKTKL